MSIEKNVFSFVFLEICVKCYKNNPQLQKNIYIFATKKVLT